MTTRKRSNSQNGETGLHEKCSDALQYQSVGERVVDPEFDSEIDALTDVIRLSRGLRSHEDEDQLAQTLFDNDKTEFGGLDLVEQLGWFDRKLGNHSDLELLSNDISKGGVRQQYLKKLLSARRILEKEYRVKRQEVERRRALQENNNDVAPEVIEPDVPNKFTRKQLMYLLQELIPDFKEADNTRKAEFIVLLSPYHSTKNISDEFSNIRNFADPTLLEEWKERFKSSGRGRKKRSS